MKLSETMIDGANYSEIAPPKKNAKKKVNEKKKSKSDGKFGKGGNSGKNGKGGNSSKLGNVTNGGNKTKSDNSGSSRFHCTICTKSYLRKRHLQRHVRDECIGIPPRFSCDYCPSRFRRKYHMVRHLTSKHGIPHEIAQQTTGSSNRNRSTRTSSSSSKKKKNGYDSYNNNLSNFAIDNSLPENLTMRKENLELKHQPSAPLQFLNYHHHLNSFGSSVATSPSYITTTSGDSGSDCNGLSPLTPASHIITMPTYGLTGAITAISAAAAHVEEKDAKILLEAAAAAAQAAATSGSNTNHHYTMPAFSPSDNNLNVAQNLIKIPTTKTTNSSLLSSANYAGSSNINNKTIIKTEQLTPPSNVNPVPSLAANTAPASTNNMNMLDDEWKMQLSLQLISNSLLNERLMNSMPFSYKNN